MSIVKHVHVLLGFCMNDTALRLRIHVHTDTRYGLLYGFTSIMLAFALSQ